MTGNGGPWGSGGGSGGDDQNGGKDRRGTGRKPGDGPQIPEIDALMKKGQEQLRVLMGGGSGGGRSTPPGGGGNPAGALFTRQGLVFGAIGVALLWFAGSRHWSPPALGAAHGRNT